METNELALKVCNVKKKYRLGVIGGGTLQGDIASWWARKRGKEDPNVKIGEESNTRNGTFMALKGISFEVKKGERLRRKWGRKIYYIKNSFPCNGTNRRRNLY